MQLENKFTIEAPLDKAWEALNTPQTIAPCFPGATLQEYEGDSFTGTVKVKLGPISLTYKGKGTYVERDEANHRVVIDASGRDVRGNGTASAKVTGTMVADGPNRTAVTMTTDMTITGRPAQFGRGVISDVADKIIGQFSTCVAGKLAPKAEKAEEAAETAPTVAPTPKHAASGGTNGSGAAAATATTTAGPVRAASPQPTGTTAPTPASAEMRSEVDAIDLLDVAGAPVMKRLAPVAGGVLLLLIIFLIRRSRRS